MIRFGYMVYLIALFSSAKKAITTARPAAMMKYIKVLFFRTSTAIKIINAMKRLRKRVMPVNIYCLSQLIFLEKYISTDSMINRATLPISNARSSSCIST